MMRWKCGCLLSCGLLSLAWASQAAATSSSSSSSRWPTATPRDPAFRHSGSRPRRPQRPRPGSFERVSTFANYTNSSDITAETVSEIVAATGDGKTLVYTDSPQRELGFVGLSDPGAPRALGKLALGGEPTSVAVLGNELALVGVNTSASLTEPSGHLAVVELATRDIVATVELAGQPDSVSISPDGRYAAIAIENERDEEVVVGGEEGGLPQAPAGFLAVVELSGSPATWSATAVDLRGLSLYGPSDPEPEFVDVREDNVAVVSLQENNHMVLVDLESASVTHHFDAGAVRLAGIDATEDGVISLTETQASIPREPDAVAWVRTSSGRSLIATANEGDLFGGSRGFSIFDESGGVVFDSGTSFEELAVRHGHYPEARSGSKGSEPESIEYARFGRTDFLFVGSERGSFVAVYTLDARGNPTFHQLLPAPLGPEGLLAIPQRNLLIVSGEEDQPSFGVRSSMMIYQLEPGAPSYPEVVSADDAAGKPIAWSALSGMVALPGKRDQVLAVWDSFYAESRVFTLDVSQSPAVITQAVALTGGSGDYDPEGIAVAPDGSWWIASEGNASGSRPNRLLHVAPDGSVLEEVGLPAAIEACRAASENRGSLGGGFEGVAVARKGRGRRSRGYELLVAQQRGWDYTTPECEALDDDPAARNAGEPTQTRLWRYDPARGDWSHIAYELEPLPENAGWVGLSEVTKVPGGYLVVERDDRTGDFAQLKTLALLGRGALRGGVRRDEKRVFDLLPELRSTNGWISDKAEGVAVTASGNTFVVTDNDGVDGWSGETRLLSLGRWWRLFD